MRAKNLTIGDIINISTALFYCSNGTIDLFDKPISVCVGEIDCNIIMLSFVPNTNIVTLKKLQQYALPSTDWQSIVEKRMKVLKGDYKISNENETTYISFWE